MVPKKSQKRWSLQQNYYVYDTDGPSENCHRFLADTRVTKEQVRVCVNNLPNMMAKQLGNESCHQVRLAFNLFMLDDNG